MFLDPLSAAPTSSVVTLGARGDSYFEYLLKTWVARGKREEDAWMRDAYVASMQSLRARLLFRSAPSDPAAAAAEGLTPAQAAAGLLYVAELHAGRAVPKMDHLVCFLPGLLALGALHGLDTRQAAGGGGVRKRAAAAAPAPPPASPTPPLTPPTWTWPAT
jgi:mannosyl-oligosaccharide alpha-1,2-mannosidase